MKYAFILFLILLFFNSSRAQPPCINVAETCNEDGCGFTYCGPYELSKGIYRLPYVDGTTLEVTCDHLSHCPRGRIDMVGTDGEINGNYHIAAAADGWIRAIVDNHSVQCDCSVDDCENNYVWMEHPNGEWTKYTHFKQHSVTNLGLSENQYILAGTYLGNEGDVGCASGQHQHFEVAQPVDTNVLIFSESGGYIDDDWAKNVIPVFCGIAGNVLERGEEYDAGDCSASCNGSILPLFPATVSIGEYDVVLNESSISNSLDYTIEGYGAALFQAGSVITLNEGFEAWANASFHARIGECDESPLKEQSVTEWNEADLVADENMKLFPNPADKMIMMEAKLGSAAPCNILLRDITGRTFLFLKSQAAENQIVQASFPVASLPNGIYVMELQQGDHSVIKKFVVQH